MGHAGVMNKKVVGLGTALILTLGITPAWAAGPYYVGKGPMGTRNCMEVVSKDSSALTARYYNRGQAPTSTTYRKQGHKWVTSEQGGGFIRFIPRKRVRIGAEGVAPWTLAKAPKRVFRSLCV